MADDFDFGFSAVTTEEYKKTQPDSEPTPSSGVSSDEIDELRKKDFKTRNQKLRV